MYGLAIGVALKVGQIFGRSVGDWILLTTNWSDSGQWIDTETWSD